MQLQASDLSAEVLPEQHAQALVLHPEYGDRRLDITVEEAEKLGELAMKDPVIVTVQFTDQEKESVRYVVAKTNFAKLATRANVETVMEEAKPLVEAPAPHPTRNRNNVDYGTLEHAGTPHKGKTSPEEGKFVRENLAAVNARLATMGQRLIDPENPDHRKRYGFDGGDQPQSPVEAPKLEVVPPVES